MLTVGDIKKLIEVFATKQDLNEFREEVATKEEQRQIMTLVDSVLGEVKTMRDEQAIHFQDHEDNRKFHKEIDSRVKRIESIPIVAHQVK